MRAIGFNDGWSYRHLGATDEPFVPVTLPHDAMLSEPRTPVAESGINSGWFEGRDYEYVRRFTPGEELAGRAMILEFEGVYHDAEVWIDGRQVAFRPYGYTDFSVDVSDALTVGREHEIRVVARNADQPNSRWYSGAGIYRPVTLWVAPRDHIKLDGVTVRTLSIGTPDESVSSGLPDGGATVPARVQFTVEATAPGSVSISVTPVPSDKLTVSRRLTGGVPTTQALGVTLPQSRLRRDSPSAGPSREANARGVCRRGASDSEPDNVARSASEIAGRAEAADGVVYATVPTAADGVAAITLDIPSPRLWSPEAPNLYTAHIRYESANADPDGTYGSHDMDETDVTFGIRTLAWGSEGFKINGRRVIIQGACIHHDNGVLGACAYPDAEERKLTLLKQAGYNAVRSAHNPCSKALLDAADRLGMLVMDEYIDHWYIHKTRHDYVDRFDRWWRQDLADMVAKDRNHPSVIMYSTGNEVGETAHHRGIALAGAMTRHLHALDPTRPVTCGINIFFNLLSAIRLGQYSDRKAEREARRAANLRKAFEQAETAKRTAQTAVRHVIRGAAAEPPFEAPGHRRSIVGSEFFNQLAGRLGADFMKTMASLPPCDWVTRGAFANMDIAGYNYGINRYGHDLARYPHRLILGTETFCTDAYRFREYAKTHPRVIGDFVWAGMDYMGETGIGSWEYEDYAPLRIGYGWLTAGSGRLDLTGRPLGEAYYTRVALEAPGADDQLGHFDQSDRVGRRNRVGHPDHVGRPDRIGHPDRGPYIAVRPVNHTDDKHSPSAWKMSDAIRSWSWNGCNGRLAHVEVYARAAAVALFVNGREVGRKTLRDECIARFMCMYRPGVIEAVAYDATGHEIGRDSLRSASDRTELRADVEWPVAAGAMNVENLGDAVGSHDAANDAESRSVHVLPGRLAFVRVRYTDEHGITKPLERGNLHAGVAGGDLLGFGCAAPFNRGSFVTGATGTYYGEALAVVRVPAGAVAGDTVTLRVTDGAHHASADIVVA
ncbi:DUF4982 domain-containing protein [Bifidobacterium amazonense]|uniref:DUF4982 domain-containing protein n=1 Tax=Bifidobacterium amazonense TaxID=2809027 RepID=A0ABS9VXE1_9BIFI|nr:glycoside hydrolase family 2 TIM barrel-domain containing protein [Bifidobacterium amazonense]MCH9276775.1 DUF4982 domain-containing protein [Bifidobacterium amazonense]